MSVMVRLLLSACALSFLAACTTMPDDEKTAINDPYENTNRKIFAFNLALITMHLNRQQIFTERQPLNLFREAYAIMCPGRECLLTAVNSALQGKFENAALASLNFLVNGLTFGFVDLMEGEDQPKREDFGQTLTSAGMDQGPYLVVPFLGSNTVRSASGRLWILFLIRLERSVEKQHQMLGTTLPIVNAVSFRATHFDTINDVKNNSLDAYARARSAYYQQRDKLLQNNLPKGEEHNGLDEFETFFHGISGLKGIIMTSPAKILF